MKKYMNIKLSNCWLFVIAVMVAIGARNILAGDVNWGEATQRAHGFFDHYKELLEKYKTQSQEMGQRRAALKTAEDEVAQLRKGMLVLKTTADEEIQKLNESFNAQMENLKSRTVEEMNVLKEAAMQSHEKAIAEAAQKFQEQLKKTQLESEAAQAKVVQKAEQEKTKLQEEITVIEKALKDQNQIVQQLKEQLETKIKENVVDKMTIEKLNNDLEAVNKSWKDAERNLSDTKISLDTQRDFVQQANAKNQTLADENAKVNEQLASLTKEFENLQAEVKAMRPYAEFVRDQISAIPTGGE